MRLSKGFHQTRLEHEKYQMNLPLWDKYILWSYSLGSGTINSYLLNTLDEDSLLIWTRRILYTYQNIKNIVLPQKYDRYKKIFAEKTSSYSDVKFRSFSHKLVALIAEDVQRIILASPQIKADIIVYKASSKYPQLKIGNVEQKLFNSTSYKVNMDFSMFLPEGGFCCMHKIVLKKGINSLILSPCLSAYPDEAEVILPYDITLEVKYISTMTLHIPLAEDYEKFIEIQYQPYTIGNVYDYNHKVECRTKERNVKMYNSIVSKMPQ